MSVEARQALQRLRPQAILELRQDLAAQALEAIPSTRRTIGGLSWIAVDGSWIWTPRSASLVRRYGRPKAGDGKLLHYPQALMVTALDVLTRIPVAIGVRGHADGERNLLRGFLDSFQAGMVAMFDRGFPAKDLLRDLTSRQAHVLWRMGTAEANSWDCVYQLLSDPAKPREALATIRVPAADGGGEIRQIRVRLIRRVFCRGRPKTGQKRETMVLMTTLWPLHAGPMPLVAFTMLCGLGFGLFNVPNNRNMFLSAPSERSGTAGGMQGTARLVGQTAGAVIMTQLFTLASAEVAPRIGLGIGSVLALAAGLVSVLRVKPAASNATAISSISRISQNIAK